MFGNTCHRFYYNGNQYEIHGAWRGFFSGLPWLHTVEGGHTYTCPAAGAIDIFQGQTDGEGFSSHWWQGLRSRMLDRRD